MFSTPGNPGEEGPVVLDEPHHEEDVQVHLFRI